MENLGEVIKQQEAKLKNLEEDLTRERGRLDSLLQLRMLVNIYKAEKPSDKFFIWCQKNGYSLNRIQVMEISRIEI